MSKDLNIILIKNLDLKLLDLRDNLVLLVIKFFFVTSKT